MAAPTRELSPIALLPLNDSLVHEMKRRSPRERRPYYGLATLRVGVGQSEATIVEWLD